MRTAKVASDQGPREVRLFARRGVWAITEAIGSWDPTGSVAVTHLPTGCRIRGAYTYAQAWRLLGRLARAGLHRSGSRASLSRRNVPEVSKRRTVAIFGARATKEIGDLVKAWREKEGLRARP